VTAVLVLVVGAPPTPTVTAVLVLVVGAPPTPTVTAVLVLVVDAPPTPTVTVVLVLVLVVGAPPTPTMTVVLVLVVDAPPTPTVTVVLVLDALLEPTRLLPLFSGRMLGPSPRERPSRPSLDEHAATASAAAPRNPTLRIHALCIAAPPVC